jgi:hypothetical protein
MTTSPIPATPTRAAAGSGERRPARVLLPLLGVAALLGLVFLLPTRDESAQHPATARLSSLRIELDEPPDWARDRGRDEVTRCLDRLDWGSHASEAAAREVLSRHAGQLAPELLSRLATVGDRDPVLASKLVELLGAEDPDAPGVLDELVARALSFNGLEARAALRILARTDRPRAVTAVRTRLVDTDPDLAGYARGALADLARRGNPEARDVILSELEKDPVDVDLAYLTVASGFPHAERTDTLLRRIAEKGNGTVRLVALTGLLARDDPWAADQLMELLRNGGLDVRQQVWRAAATAHKVFGQDEWSQTLKDNIFSIASCVVSVLFVAYDTGHPDAARALELLEREATNPSSSVQSLVLDELFIRRHPNVIETLRGELPVLTGTNLGLTVDRIIMGPKDRPADLALRADLAQLALTRLENDRDLRDVDRVSLCRLLSDIAPEQSAPVLVDYALGRRGASPTVAEAVADLLGPLGDAGLARLQPELGTPAVDELAVYAAAQARSPAALPLLEQIIQAPGTAPALRVAALDCIALIPSGPREELLRRVIPTLGDPELAHRAQLIFWNYL